MKKNIFITLLVFSCYTQTVWAQAKEKTITVELTNSWNQPKTDEPIVMKLKDVNAEFTIKSAVVMDGNIEVPSQLDDLDKDRQADELAFVVDLSAKSKKIINIIFSAEKSNKQYPPRVYAEMLVSDKKGKHVPVQSLTIPGTSNIYNQMHHHGPAFESELVAYRIYFDQKQTIDIYGKFNKGLEIKESQFYPTDEQLARGFGDDVLLVKGSCGAGTLKGWDGQNATHITPVETRTERIVAYGPVRTIAEVEVAGWEYQGSELDMINRYTLYAGHRDVQIDVKFKKTLNNETFCTGVQNIKGSASFSDHKGLIGCWGRHWPVNDTVKYAKETVGIGTYIPQKYTKNEVTDNLNFLYTINASGQQEFTYYTTFTSMKETFGYKTPEAWFEYIQVWKENIEHPCSIKIKHKNKK